MRERTEDTGETPEARLARNMSDLLQELRVAQAGVQILFAFLLSVSFTDRFAHATELQRVTVIVTVLLTTASTALLVAPAAWHRVYFHQGRRADIIRWANRCALAGLGLLAAAMSGAVLLVADVVIGGVTAIVMACGAGVVFLSTWFVLPITRRNR
jgi:hypothetical protein